MYLKSINFREKKLRFEDIMHSFSLRKCTIMIAMSYNDIDWHIPRLNSNQFWTITFCFGCEKSNIDLRKIIKRVSCNLAFLFSLFLFFVNINRKHILHNDNLISFSYTSRRLNLNLHLKKEKRKKKQSWKTCTCVDGFKQRLHWKQRKVERKKKSPKHITIEK